jgi:hypothetical protein
VRYADREEGIEAGDAPTTCRRGKPPSWRPVEFSPKDEFRKTMEVAERNFAAMQESQ